MSRKHRNTDSIVPPITHSLVALRGNIVTHSVGGIQAPVQIAEALIECMITNAPTASKRAKLATHKVAENPNTGHRRLVSTGLSKAIARTVSRGGSVTSIAFDTKGDVVASCKLQAGG